MKNLKSSKKYGVVNRKIGIGINLVTRLLPEGWFGIGNQQRNLNNDKMTLNKDKVKLDNIQ